MLFLRIPVVSTDDDDDEYESDSDDDDDDMAAFGLSPYFVDMDKLELVNPYANI